MSLQINVLLHQTANISWFKSQFVNESENVLGFKYLENVFRDNKRGCLTKIDIPIRLNFFFQNINCFIYFPCIAAS